MPLMGLSVDWTWPNISLRISQEKQPKLRNKGKRLEENIEQNIQRIDLLFSSPDLRAAQPGKIVIQGGIGKKGQHRYGAPSVRRTAEAGAGS